MHQPMNIHSVMETAPASQHMAMAPGDQYLKLSFGLTQITQ